jgi:apolipoprotein N-acyltransferase
MKLQSILLSIISGILFWLAWPTYGFAGLLFIAFVPLLILENSIRKSGTTRKGMQVFFHSYLTFFIWNIATTYWLYYSTAFGMWFAVLANTALMSLVFLGYHFLARKATTGAALTFLACLWISFERLHLDWDFSWPWLNLGNGFSENTSWIQWYEYTGTFGGSLWVWLVNIVVFLSWLRFRESGIKSNTNPIIKRSLVLIALISIPIIASQIIVNDLKTENIDNQSNIVIVQPNIDPYSEKYFMTNDSIAALIMDLALPETNHLTDLILTPETVLAENIQLYQLGQLENNRAVNQLRVAMLNYPNAHYLGGLSIAEVFRDKKRLTIQSNVAGDGSVFYNDYNSAMFLAAGDTLQLYHKSKLVVGVENFPYKGILQPLLGDAMIDLGGTTATKTTQKERSIFKLNANSKAAPVICYESVYGDYVTDYVKKGATFLTIITNDAWWDNTQGHKQHLSLARLRAIENRRWIARSANTGISAIIDDRGAIKQSLEYGVAGVITGTIENQTRNTFYTTHGDYIARVAGLMGLFVLLFGIFKKGSIKRK